jgi:hypothetical protein
MNPLTRQGFVITRDYNRMHSFMGLDPKLLLKSRQIK